MLLFFVAVQCATIVVNTSIISHRQETTKEIHKKLNLVCIKFTEKEWTLVKKLGKHEIELQGQMFDIQSVHQKNGEIYVNGQFDTKEDTLISLSKGFEKKDQNTEKQNPIFNLLFCEEQISYSFFQTRPDVRQFVFMNQIMPSSFLTNDSPPPKA